MSTKPTDIDAYRLSEQAGFNLRRANQRHVAIFSRLVEGLTPTQFAALARLYEFGALSQNRLGRLTAMDSATIKGVVERLKAKDLVSSRADLSDQRLRLVELSDKGREVFERALGGALDARVETLSPLTEEEARAFEALLAKLV
ncbi:MarR family transcriptional regulator [Roseobacter sp. YSTF-M11]|uniref:MarR family transcriptional regulator n=1 Tax=Roseobacter insulae TaxID=2859783 RepID=A0A9X1K2F2_9RHOB|nr:MarR family transcriptional regulator [Roseobacter insulae]MBW4707517.1 MarR family transcriptional regulator [Roseobacter insulae]